MTKYLATVLLVLFASGSAAVRAVGVDDLSAFARIPIVLNGRTVPMDTYARHMLLQFSGRRSVQGVPAANWMAKVFFDDEATLKDKVFLINHPDVVEALHMEAEDRRRYSAEQLGASIHLLADLATRASAVPQEERSIADKELMRVYGNLAVYMDLARAFDFARPSPDMSVALEETAQLLGLEEGVGAYSYFDIFSRARGLRQSIEAMKTRKPETWTEQEQETFRLSQALFSRANAPRSSSFTVIPAPSHDQDLWVSAWDVFALRLNYPALLTAVGNLQSMAKAYASGDQEAFDRAAGDFILYSDSHLKNNRDRKHADLELLLNRANPFLWSKMVYFLAFLFAFGAMLSSGRFARGAALLLTGVALVPHTAGIVMRMLIMGRPPVTNLYATFIFVAWVCVVLGTLIEFGQKNRLGVLASSFSGLALLMLAGRFAMEGDTMGKMVAVLDSNFWLSTHVIAITTGYAGCVLAGLIAHVYLLSAAIAPNRRDQLDSIYRSLVGVLGFGLTFSFLGTMLGGVWADQSWGRFWGWDPKENGALLIVIWCSILFHAKLGRMIDRVGMAAGTALGIIVVMVAWLGVNLLGVGLHSYGFTSGLARGLLIYIAVQIVVVAGLSVFAVRRIRTAA